MIQTPQIDRRALPCPMCLLKRSIRNLNFTKLGFTQAKPTILCATNLTLSTHLLFRDWQLLVRFKPLMWCYSSGSNYSEKCEFLLV